MIQETDDDRLDQSLRDTFSDFDLPPSGHVWSGVEGRLSAQPGPPRQVPVLLLLPAAALVGVAVGWLLPHPSSVPPAPPAAAVAQIATSPAARPGQLSKAEVATQATAPALAGTQAFRVAPLVVARQPARGATATVSTAQRHQSAGPLALTTAATSHEEFLPVAPIPVVPEAASETSLPTVTATASSNPPRQDTAVAEASAAYATIPSTPPSKGDNRQEWRPEYRMPKHRLAERGLGIRRLRNNITKRWQHFFGPRRTTRTIQPAS